MRIFATQSMTEGRVFSAHLYEVPIVNLIGTQCTQSNYTSSGTLTVDQATINLIGTVSVQGSFSGVGSITVTPASLTTIVAPHRVLRTVGGNQYARENTPIATDTFYAAGARWVIDKDLNEVSYYARDVGPDLAASSTTLSQVDIISSGVTLLAGPTIQDNTIVFMVGGGSELKSVPNYVTIRVSCANGEIFDRTMHFKLKSS